MYRAAEYLITAGHAYVDEQTAEEMRANRGDFGKPGVDSPFRSRSPDENLARFREMRDGKLADGAAVLRAKIDMASPNINLRDPAIYRIRRATHHNTGDAWCIYPMYTFAHPIEDALEQITHSIARWNSKTSARSTTGCWSVCAKAACSRPHRRGSTNLRA
jgi:glutaminyl-tRNA synthetase